jgi:SET domain-containing protein
VLDATVKGSDARYINHSCDANCATEKWLAGRETRIGIFAKRAIPAGEEITYDYQLEWNGYARVKYALC